MVGAPRPGRPASRSARRGSARRHRALVRRVREAEIGWLALLVVLVLALVVVLGRGLPWAPISALVVPMVVANIVLSPRTLPWLVLLTLAAGIVVLVVSPMAVLDGRRLGGVVIVAAVGLVILASARARAALGVAGGRGESMLVDLRDRIGKQAQMPALPRGWYSDAVMRSAGGSSFAGDFLVGSLSRDGARLEVAVVDVSGKGARAGTRALQLSGSFGGLLGALPPPAFLPAANDYLLRQDWDEGFATAVHLSLDLRSGDFELRSAGHPPAVQLHAGSGRWEVHGPEGPVLGLMDGATFEAATGALRPGDALLLYTDGLVETPERDISSGIDKLLGAGEQLLRSGFEGGAQRLVDRLEGTDDDRALLLLHRR